MASELEYRLEQVEEEIKKIKEEFYKKDLIVVPLRDGAIIPRYAHDGDSGLDLYTVEPCTLNPGETKIVPTGIAFVIPKTANRTFDVTVKGRSGNDSKGLNVITTKMVFDEKNGDYEVDEVEKCDISIKQGTVDNIYTGEVGIITKNNSYNTITIAAKTKLAQAIVREAVLVNVVEGTKEDIPKTPRNAEGYGSTGV